MLTSMAASWLLVHLIVKHRFATLMTKLPDAYQFAIAVPPQEGEAPNLIALCIDLIRKEHSSVPFDMLGPSEKKMALHAYAVQFLPRWMSSYAAILLSPANKVILEQLRQVKSSRPQKPKQHFGAIRQQQRLRSPSET